LDESADDRILRDLRLPRTVAVTVVTDDRELRGLAKQLKANTVGIARFVERLNKTGTPSKGPSKSRGGKQRTSSHDKDGRPTSVSAQEVDDWMRTFGFEEDENKP
jgi:hypothetical protein